MWTWNSVRALCTASNVGRAAENEHAQGPLRPRESPPGCSGVPPFSFVVAAAYEYDGRQHAAAAPPPKQAETKSKAGRPLASSLSRDLLDDLLATARASRRRDLVHLLERPASPGSLQEFHARYEIQRGKIKDIDKLGEGAFGSVMRCGHRQSRAKRAVKVGDAEDRASFQLWNELGRHPNIVELIEHFEANHGRKQIAVMTLCYGSDVCEWLLHHLETEKKLPPFSKVLRLFLQMCEAVDHCHQKGILHRDVKLENFLFEDAAEHHVRLCDFGALQRIPDAAAVAAAAGPGGGGGSAGGANHGGSFGGLMKTRSILVGTMQYLAPECIQAASYSEKSDVYALGVVLFVLVTGSFPYPIDEKKALAAGSGFVFPKVQFSRIKEDSLRKILQGMLHPDPAARWSLEMVCKAIHRERAVVVSRFASEKVADLETRVAMQSDRLLDEALASARSRKRYLNLQAKDVLFTEGQLIDDASLFVIQKGTLEVHKQGVHITTLSEGSLVGEMSLLLNSTERTATVNAGPNGAKLLRVEAQDILHEEGSSIRMRALAEMATLRLSQGETLQYLETAFPESDLLFLRKLLELFESNPVMFHPQQQLFAEGDRVSEDRSVFFVRSGELDVFAGDERIATVSAGSVIGEMSALLAYAYPDLYGKERRSSTVRSVGHCECSVLHWSEVEKLLEEFPEEKQRFVAMAENRHAANCEKVGGEAELLLRLRKSMVKQDKEKQQAEAATKRSSGTRTAKT